VAEITTPRDLFLHELGDIMYVEQKLSTEVLPKLISEVTDAAVQFQVSGGRPYPSGGLEIGNALRALLSADGQFEELAPTDNKLSKRQKQLIVMLDRGLSNREIADELGISEHTVKVHLWRLFRRLGVKSRTQTIHYARTHGMLAS